MKVMDIVDLPHAICDFGTCWLELKRDLPHLHGG